MKYSGNVDTNIIETKLFILLFRKRAHFCNKIIRWKNKKTFINSLLN